MKSKLLAAALIAISMQANAADMNIDGTYYSSWNATGPDIGYLFAGFVTRQPNPAVPDMSTFTVGAQINAGNAAGVNQGVWGIATEAWAYPGSRSPLFGIEATSINMEPSNSLPKVAFYATFKNRPDGAVKLIPVDPMNVGSQAVRIDAQPGTGMSEPFAPGKPRLDNQVPEYLITTDQRPQPVHGDGKHFARFHDDGGGKQVLTGQQIQLGHELAWSPGRQFALDPGLVIADLHLAGEDHEEVVTAVPFPEQDLSRSRGAHVANPAQRGDVIIGQRP